jgi:hypothetical protein
VGPAAAFASAQRRDAVDQVAGVAAGAHQVVGEGHVDSPTAIAVSATSTKLTW